MIEKSSAIVRTMTTAMRTWVDDSGDNFYHDVDFAHHGVNGEVPDFDCNHNHFEFRGPEI